MSRAPSSPRPFSGQPTASEADANPPAAVFTKLADAELQRLRRVLEAHASPVPAGERERCEHCELHHLNRVLEAQTAQLLSSNRELDSFSSSVSHDLRAPLRAISGFSRLLVEQHSAGLDEVGRSYLLRINRASQRMGELIDSLLSLSRVTRTELKRERLDLGRLAREIVNELATSEPDRDVECRIANQVIVEGDLELLRSALGNLLANAWKFTAGVPSARIEFGTATEGGERTFFVRDNGAGFDMKFVDQLFNPFHRLHSAKEFPGSGIGLAIVQRVIARHRGRVWAQSNVGGGALFSFTLGGR